MWLVEIQHRVKFYTEFCLLDRVLVAFFFTWTGRDTNPRQRDWSITRLFFFSVCSKFGGTNLTVGGAPFPVDDVDDVIVVVDTSATVVFVVANDGSLFLMEKLEQVAPLLDSGVTKNISTDFNELEYNFTILQGHRTNSHSI